jgi:DNA-binding CsgD family transcriptional regulator
MRARFDEGRLLAGVIPGARFVPIASNNHIPLEHEAGWRAWLDEVRAFLPAPQTGAFAELTARERELLDLIAAGLSNPQIAACLALSAKTVKNHITSIFAKLGIQSRGRAIILGRDAGLGRAGSPVPNPRA